MSRKSLAVALLAFSLTTALAAPVQAASLRQRDASPIMRVFKALGRWLVALSDGAEITIPKP